MSGYFWCFYCSINSPYLISSHISFEYIRLNILVFTENCLNVHCLKLIRMLSHIIKRKDLPHCIISYRVFLFTNIFSNISLPREGLGKKIFYFTLIPISSVSQFSAFRSYNSLWQYTLQRLKFMIFSFFCEVVGFPIFGIRLALAMAGFYIFSAVSFVEAPLFCTYLRCYCNAFNEELCLWFSF